MSVVMRRKKKKNEERRNLSSFSACQHTQMGYVLEFVEKGLCRSTNALARAPDVLAK